MGPNYRVGQYVLERPLGAGGMAEVWLANHVLLGTPAAVKFLSPTYSGAGDIEQRFLNEGKRQGSLNHPNIIKVYGFDYVEGRSFLILQYIKGESLDDLLRRVGRLEPAEAVRIAISVLNALDYAHDHSIVHRDIKPSNILLDENGVPYLGDFGIVLATNEKRLTRTGTAMGTALYMSPEQIRDPSSVDRRSDIYSFGCVLYEMLAGEPPFNPATGQGDTDFTVKLMHVQQPPPPLREKIPYVPPALEAVVMNCLAKTPDQRYGTCREVREALSRASLPGAQPDARKMTPPPVAPVRPVSNTPVPSSPIGSFVTPIGPVQPAGPGPWLPQQGLPQPQLVPCPNCKRAVPMGARQCPFCSFALAFAFGALPTLGPGNLARTASGAKICGVISLILTLGAPAVAAAMSSPVRDDAAGFLGFMVIIGIFLAIAAIVKGNGAKRILSHYAFDPVVRGKAVAGIVMGWVTVGLWVLAIIVIANRH